MKAVVVYESLWGNTAVVARAVAEGIGEGAVALPTKDAGADELAGADLIVAGGPVFAFHLSPERSRHDIAEHPERLQALDTSFVERLQSLTTDIEVDLDAPLSADDE